MKSGIFYPVVSADDGTIMYPSYFWNNIDGSVIGCGTGSNDYDVTSYIRFPAINIPRGSTILEAYVKVTCYATKTMTPVNVNIYFNNVDNAVAPTNIPSGTGYGEVVALALTGAVAWNAIPVWTNGLQYDTPELKTILQNITDRAEWSENNAVMVVIKNNGSINDRKRQFSSIDQMGGTEKPELHIEWEPPQVKISDALKKAREVHFLVELNFGGLIKRFSHSNITVPYSTGTDRFFEAKILNDLTIGSKFDITDMKYSSQSILIDIANDIRMQDHEVNQLLDGGAGIIYAWCEGLDWTDIETDGIIFCGIFSKIKHDNFVYSFSLKDETQNKFHTIPEVMINENTWPNMRLTAGSGSVAGKSAPLIFGEFTKGVPLLCVDTAAYKYLVCAGTAKSTEAEYNAGTQDVFDKDGNIITPANYTVYKAVDGEGNLETYFTFTGDQTSLEPLSCSIEGSYDVSGEITGTANELIEHPADIYRYLLKHHSDIENINIGSIQTMKSVLHKLKFSTIINSTVLTGSIINRILAQCQSMSTQRRGGGLGVITMNPESELSQIRIKRDMDIIGENIQITATQDSSVVNDLLIQFSYNPTTHKYEKSLEKNHTNNSVCEKSYFEYGKRAQKILRMPDVSMVSDAEYIANRYLSFYAFRHDLVHFAVPYENAFELQRGDIGLITAIEGKSCDGAGYVDKKMILVEKIYYKDRINQTWWVVETD